MAFDVMLIHPPAIYDFRRKILFPGPIAYTVPESTDQFIMPPVGMLSIAGLLDNSGYNVVIDNLGYRMVSEDSFDVERHIRRSDAKVYAIGLHWLVHCQGAIRVAELCKKFHPNAVVVVGGLTATCFHLELIQRFRFVDAVIRGEAEKPLLEFVEKLENRGKIEAISNVTVRGENGKILTGEMAKPEVDISIFDFTRLDLLEPCVFPAWSLPVCRGCVHNCVSCGGSAYSYKTYLGREKPSFRSPSKIADDLQKLSEQNVKLVFLFQDPRMGGQKYHRELIRRIKEEKVDLTRLSLELFEPAGEDYIKELSKVNIPLTLTVSPESGVDHVRMAHGRNYTSKELLKTIEICQKYSINLMVFFMFALANETRETLEETWRLWEKICCMDKASKAGPKPTVNYAFGPMILLDPGSMAFDHQEKYGYKLIFKNLQQHIDAFSMPSWHQWINYETKFLKRNEIVDLILNLIERSIDLRERYGIYDRTQAAKERIRHIYANRFVIKEVDRIMQISGENEKKARLEKLNESLNRYLEGVLNV